MANYVDGFVFPVPRKHLDEYRSAAEAAAEIWKEHGALAYFEYIGDDLTLEGTRSFVDVAEAKDDEVIVFGWVAFDSRETRDLANKKVAIDPRMPELINPLMNPTRMIFDASRMVYGGFRSSISSE